VTGKTFLSSILAKHTGHTGNASICDFVKSVISKPDTILQGYDDKPRYRTASGKNSHFRYLVNPDHIYSLCIKTAF
jgi:hypothetical protein